MKRFERYLLILLLGIFGGAYADERGDDQHVEGDAMDAKQEKERRKEEKRLEKERAKAEKQREKEEARAAKEMTKERERAEKEARKEQERLEKEQAKQEKEREKEERRAAKDREKQEKQREKEEARAAKETEKEEKTRAKEEERRAKELAKEREKAEKEARKEQERLEKERSKQEKENEKDERRAAKEREKEEKARAKEEERRAKELAKEREKAEKEARKEQEYLEKERSKQEKERAKEEAREAKEKSKEERMQEKQEERREKQLQREREQAAKEERKEQERLEKERAKEEKQREKEEAREAKRNEKEEKACAKEEARREKEMEKERERAEQDARKEQEKAEKERARREKDRAKAEHEAMLEQEREKAREKVRKEMEEQRAQEQAEREERAEQERLEREKIRRENDEMRSSLEDRDQYIEQTRQNLVNKEIETKEDRKMRRQAEKELKHEEREQRREEYRAKHKNKRIQSDEEAEYQRLMRQQKKLDREHGKLMKVKQRREDAKNLASQERLDRKLTRSNKLRNGIDDQEQWQEEVDREKVLRQERALEKKQAREDKHRRKQDREARKQEQVARQQEEEEHRRLTRERKKIERQEAARLVKVRKHEIKQMKKEMREERLNKRIEKIRVQREQNQDKRVEWKDYRALEVDLDRSTGAFADLYKSPSWPFYALYFSKPHLLRVGASYKHASGSYDNDGDRRGIEKLAFGDCPIKLKDISLASNLLNQGLINYLRPIQTLPTDCLPAGTPPCPATEIKFCADDKIGKALKDLACNDILFKAQQDIWAVSFDLARYLHGHDLAVGIEVPIVYSKHRLSVEIMTQDKSGAAAGADETIAPIVLKNLLRAKGMSEIGGSEGGLGDIGIFLNAQVKSKRFEKFVTGIHVEIPTAKRASLAKLWAPSLGNGRFWEFDIFAALQCYYNRYLNPHILVQGTFSTAANVNRRIPKKITSPTTGSFQNLQQFMALGNHVTFANSEDGTVEDMANQAKPFSAFDTNIPAFADNIARVKVSPGPEFNLKVGNVMETLIFRRDFLELFYDFRAKASDAVSGLPRDTWDLTALKEKTQEIEHKVGTEYSYQFDYGTRLRLGLQYTFAGKNVAQTLEATGSFDYSF